MEFLVQLFRALANRERIKILRLLVVCGETRVSRIAEAVELAINLVSAHLKVLSAAGLVWRRRSGRTTGYRPAEQAGNPVTATVLWALPQTFGSIHHEDPKKVVSSDQAASATDSDAALFAFFTAYTHPRRLQILRFVAERTGTPLSDLRTALSMSERACLRHLSKLDRRRLVARQTTGRRAAYVPTTPDGRLQRSVSDAVRSYLASTKQ